jgi:PhoPQ-activated pathogenicity-related protein
MIDRFQPAKSTARGRSSRRAGLHWHRPNFETLESRCLLSITSAVVGRHIFYDNSFFDGNTPGVNAAGDDAAIATDKSALLGDATLASPANITSYSRGINGIMVDISGSHPDITQSDFVFKVGSNNMPGSWNLAPDPAAVVVRPGEGFGSSDRVEIVWPDFAIANTMLEVIVAANDNTGLAVSDVFFYGNRKSDSGESTPATFFQTTASDSSTIFGHLTGTADVENDYDYDRSGNVTASDASQVFGSLGVLIRIDVLVSPPALAADLAMDTGPDGTPNSDGITADPTVAGTLTASTSIASFKVGLNSGPVTTNALGQLSGGTFSLNQAFLETINGGPLADGPYVVHLQTVDADGLGAAAEVALTLKTSIATPAIPDLIAADDSGASSTDDITKINTPRIDVSAETGSLVRIYVDGSPVDTGTGGPGLQFMLATLSDGPHNVHVVSQDGAGNSATSPTLPITVSTVLPTISATTLVTISSDLTPHVNVQASGPLGLPNGTVVTVDVDLNYDNDFSGGGEMNRTTSTLYNGKSFFQVTPALPADVGGAAYYVQLRARVTDIAGNEGISTPQSLYIDRIGNTVLDDYVTSTATPTYSFVSTLPGPDVSPPTGPDYTVHVIDLTSQTWNPPGGVDKPVWKHWLEIIIPSGTVGNSALLLIDGGNNISGAPTSIDSTTALLGSLATQLHSVVVRLPTVPSEPLTFPGEGARSEDDIIAYTFDQYANNLGSPGNETWPLLLPMVQSAVAAMDTTQVYVPTVVSGGHIDDFVVSGYSKRGWTTWLTAAVDDRVRAIIPGVIEVLNMGEQMVHHYGAYGFFSPAVDPYTAFNIPQESYTTGGQEVGRVVDPYMYIYNGKFDDMPKLMLSSSGDQYFLPDAAEYFFSDLPGTENYIRYIPNTNHGLNSTDPVNSSLSFFDAVVNGTALPEFSWTVGQDGSINVQTVTTPIVNGVKLWQATNPTSRDFRKDYVPGSVVWTSSILADQGGGTYVGNVVTPGSGATAYFVELTFDDPVAGMPDFVFTTQIKVATDIPLVAWPFFMPTNPPPPPPAPPPGASPLSGGSGDSGSSRGNLNAVAVALAAPAGDGSSGTTLQPPLVTPSVTALPARAAEVDEALASDWSWADDNDDAPSAEEDDELALILLGDDWQ